MQSYGDPRLLVRSNCHAGAWFLFRLRPGPTWATIVLNDPCSYCCSRNRKRTRDHIHPESKGGTREWSNITGACGLCQREKADLPLLLFLATRRDRRRWYKTLRRRITRKRARQRNALDAGAE